MRFQANRWHILGCLTGLACFFVAAQVASEHMPSLAWMARYTSASGTYCCSERDCIPATVALWPSALEAGTMVVRVNGVLLLLPEKSVHRSEDGNTWWCCKTDAERTCPSTPRAETTRCVFHTGGV